MNEINQMELFYKEENLHCITGVQTRFKKIKSIQGNNLYIILKKGHRKIHRDYAEVGGKGQKYEEI